MNSRKINNFLISTISMLMLAWLPNEMQANETHPFYTDVKEAYKDSKLIYNLSVERILYHKLAKPQDVIEQRGFLSELPKPRSPEEEQVMSQTLEALHRQFFKKVKTGETYCPVGKIKEKFGMTPKERIGISSGGYYRLFVAYWTLNIKLDENTQSNISKYGYGKVYYADSLLRFVESSLAGAFFPTPGPMQIQESTRRQGIQKWLNMFAPTMTIKELYEGADPEKARWPILK
jgi:hypothetical protein